MGSYWSLSVDGYDILSSKSEVDHVTMALFTEADKYVRTVMGSTASEDENSFDEVGYRATASVMCDRLEAMGFSLNSARRAFERGMQEVVETAENDATDSPFAERARAELELLRNLSFDVWIKSFRSLKAGLVRRSILFNKEDEGIARGLAPHARLVLEGGRDEFPFYFPVRDIRFFYRAVIETCGPDSVFIADLSDLVDGGYYDSGDAVADDARLQLVADYPLNTKLIVLTEGKSDSRILEASLGLLYPHLPSFYTFMDFEGANAQGGAGQLVNTVKAFAGAGIANRIVALFDNDTAARAALRGLSRAELPSSMHIFQFPSISIGTAYPTVGPSGCVAMDVNGSAGSLELYLGVDVLRNEEGTLTPVQWRNFDAGVGAYQGELENKGGLQERFWNKLAQASENPKVIPAQDWRGILSILNMIRGAFENESR